MPRERQRHAADVLTRASSPLIARSYGYQMVTLGSRWPSRVPSSAACSPGPRPANVGRWVNIGDYGDPIAILRPFKSYFPGADLDLTESVGLFGFHRAARYLACASLAATLQPLLKGT
jgi:hypothetical protein